jgi:hypothetical protein
VLRFCYNSQSQFKSLSTAPTNSYVAVFEMFVPPTTRCNPMILILGVSSILHPMSPALWNVQYTDCCCSLVIASIVLSDSFCILISSYYFVFWNSDLWFFITSKVAGFYVLLTVFPGCGLTQVLQILYTFPFPVQVRVSIRVRVLLAFLYYSASLLLTMGTLSFCLF